MNILNQPWFLALVAIAPGLVLGILAYLRSLKVDKVTEQSGAATAQAGAVNQVITGLNLLVENLQQDNEIFRKSKDGLVAELQTMSARLEKALAERDECRKEFQALTKKYESG